MAPGSDSSKVYRFVIDNVVARLKDEFAAANVDESVLFELRSKWEEKLVQQGLIYDHSNPDEISGHPGLAETTYRVKHERYEEDAVGIVDGTGKRGYVGGNHGAPGAKHARTGEGVYPGSSYLPQHDGPGDEYESQKPGPASSKNEGEEDAEAPADPEEEALSDDDSDEADEEEEEVENLLVGQFEKVNKVKVRRHVIMKDCVFHLGGKDYLVKKCTGDFMWV